MDKETKHLYSEAKKYSMAVVEKPFSKEDFLKHLRMGVEKIYNRSKTLLKFHQMYANMLGFYLDKYKIDQIVPDEKFFNEMWDRLMADGLLNGREYRIYTRKKVARTARLVVNEYFYSQGLTQRKVLIKMVISRYEKFFALTKKSQDAIVWFERYGKAVKAISVLVEGKEGSLSETIKTIHRMSNNDLLPVTKSGKIDHALRLLQVVGKNGFEFIENADVKKLEDYCKERNVVQIQDYLAHCATFFINIQSQGFVKHNPFGSVSLKMKGGVVRKDFIAPKDMERFRDLSTINLKNELQVRDRLFVLLAYDLALRLNELLALEVSDIRKDPEGDWHVILKSSIQKGQNKDEEIMYFFFEETKSLLEIYIKDMRKKFKPTTNFLIVSNRGGALNSQHCRIRFHHMCSQLGIKTFYGKNPSPHVLRHSFATVNIEPLGLSLPLYEMAQRLRHIRVETTRKHYIHNNPFLQKMKHKVYRDKGNKKSTRDVLDGIPLADLEHWLSDKLHIDSSTVKSIRAQHKKTFVDPLKAQDDTNRAYLSEEEAIERIKNLMISPLALRQYAKAKGMLSDDHNGTLKFGSGFHYKEEFIDDLAKNWVTVRNVLEKLKMSSRTFQRMVQREKWRILRVGKYRLMHRDDII